MQDAVLDVVGEDLKYKIMKESMNCEEANLKS